MPQTACDTQDGGTQVPMLRGEFNRIEVPGVNALGPLEERIMKVMWKLNESAVPQVYRTLRDEMAAEGVTGDQEIKYTTVVTTMSRLVRKKLLTQDRGKSVFTYKVTMQPEDVADYQAKLLVGEVIKTLGSDRIQKALAEQVGQGVRND